MGRSARKHKPSESARLPLAPASPKPQWWVGAALVLITFLAYLPAMSAGFIWDDDYYVYHNLALRSFDGLLALWSTLGTVPQYYPLTHTTFWLEYHLWGNSPAGYHITNVLIHAASVVILWRLLIRLKVPAAVFAAALFAVHPIGVESVAWVTERKNVLSGFLYLSAATMYWRAIGDAIGDADDQREPTFHVGFYVAAVLLFVCALLSKTTASTLPAAMLLMLWWRRGRLRFKDFAPAIPLLLLGAAMGSLTSHMERQYVGAYGPDWAFSVADRILIAGRAAWFYVTKLLCPVNLTFIYPRWNINPASWWQWLYPSAVIAVVITLFALGRKIGRGPVTAVLFFLGTLAPALGFFNIFPMMYSFVADHFAYLASIGIFALACGAVASLRALPRKLAIAAGLCAILVCAILTFQQARTYQDRRTLWVNTLARNPDAWMAASNLAAEYLDEAETLPPDHQKELATRARELLERSIATKPNNPTALVHLGSALSMLGDEAPAIELWSSVMAMKDKTNPRAWPIAASNAQYQLGRHYRKAGDADQAREHFRRAMEILPGNVPAMVQMASLLASAGEFEEAARLFDQAAQQDPDSPSLWTSVGNFRLQAGHPQEAVEAFDRAIALAPRHLPARYGKAIALASGGQLAAAETGLRQLAGEYPNSPDVLSSLGTVLLKSNRIDEARALFGQALQVQPNHPQALRQMQQIDASGR